MDQVLKEWQDNIIINYCTRFSNNMEFHSYKYNFKRYIQSYLAVL